MTAQSAIEKELDELRTSSTDEQTVSTTTLSELNELAMLIAVLRDDEKRAKDAAKDITAQLEAKENRMVEILLENGMQNYRAPAGLCSLSFRTSVRQPQGDARNQFYEWLKKENRFEDMISVNSQTLNSYYKEQFELAKERGDSDFSIPGLTEVKINPSLSFKRNK